MLTLRFSKDLIEKLKIQLRTAYQTNDFRLYRITQGLLWLSEGRTVKKIAILFNVSERTPYNWLKAFLQGGMNWLKNERHKGHGRKPKLTKVQKKELKGLIELGPEKNDFDSGVWNSAMINELILRRYAVSFAPRYLCTLLKKMGLSYQKAAFITDRSDEEEYKKQQKHWQEETWPTILKKAREEQSVILFGDEVSFAMWGSLSRTWAPIGQQPQVKTKGIRKGLKMYGVIEFEGGGFYSMESLQYVLKPKSLKELKKAGVPTSVIEPLKSLKNTAFKTLAAFIEQLDSVLGKDTASHYHTIILKYSEVAGRFNKEGYVEFLKQIMARFKGNIILVEDGASYHKAGLVQAFVNTLNGRLTIERLPAFSPKLNPIEKLWRNTKRDATHLKYFETFEALRESVCKTFKKYLQDASLVVCVMKKLREMAGILTADVDSPVVC